MHPPKQRTPRAFTLSKRSTSAPCRLRALLQKFNACGFFATPSKCFTFLGPTHTATVCQICFSATFLLASISCIPCTSLISCIAAFAQKSLGILLAKRGAPSLRPFVSAVSAPVAHHAAPSATIFNAATSEMRPQPQCTVTPPRSITYTLRPRRCTCAKLFVSYIFRCSHKGLYVLTTLLRWYLLQFLAIC